MLPYLRAREDMSEHDGRRFCIQILERHKHYHSPSPDVIVDMSFTMQMYRERANATFKAAGIIGEQQDFASLTPDEVKHLCSHIAIHSEQFSTYYN